MRAKTCATIGLDYPVERAKDNKLKSQQFQGYWNLTTLVRELDVIMILIWKVMWMNRQSLGQMSQDQRESITQIFYPVHQDA